MIFLPKDICTHTYAHDCTFLRKRHVSSAYLCTHAINYALYVAPRARRDIMFLLSVYMQLCCWLTVLVERVIAFSHGEAYERIASLATDSTRDAAHTEGEPGEDGLAWTLVYSLFLFLYLDRSPSTRPKVSLATCSLSLSLRSSVFIPLTLA